MRCVRQLMGHKADAVQGLCQQPSRSVHSSPLYPQDPHVVHIGIMGGPGTRAEIELTNRAGHVDTVRLTCSFVDYTLDGTLREVQGPSEAHRQHGEARVHQSARLNTLSLNLAHPRLCSRQSRKPEEFGKLSLQAQPIEAILHIAFGQEQGIVLTHVEPTKMFDRTQLHAGRLRKQPVCRARIDDQPQRPILFPNEKGTHRAPHRAAPRDKPTSVQV